MRNTTLTARKPDRTDRVAISATAQDVEGVALAGGRPLPSPTKGAEADVLAGGTYANAVVTIYLERR